MSEKNKDAARNQQEIKEMQAIQKMQQAQAAKKLQQTQPSDTAATPTAAAPAPTKATQSNEAPPASQSPTPVEAPQAAPAPQKTTSPTPPGDDLIIDMHGIIKRFYVGTSSELEILHGIDLQVRRGEFVAIVGASGSGKSTLMNIIGALDRPTEGTYYLDGLNVEQQGDRQLSKIRCAKIGFVFQTFNLVPRTNAIKNVELPMMYAGLSGFERTRRAKELLEMVEMSDRAHHQPSELSGGQKQRVAIARSMANDPAIILADEPTGALDSKTGRLVMDLFHRLHEEQGKTIVLITHSNELAEECGRVVTIRDGNVVSERLGSGRARAGTPTSGAPAARAQNGGDAHAAV